MCCTSRVGGTSGSWKKDVEKCCVTNCFFAVVAEMSMSPTKTSFSTRTIVDPRQNILYTDVQKGLFWVPRIEPEYLPIY